jgi:hypothetical protein
MAIDWFSAMAMMCSTQVMTGAGPTKGLEDARLHVLKDRRCSRVSKLSFHKELVKVTRELSMQFKAGKEARVHHWASGRRI